MLCSVDDRTGKHSATKDDLRTNAQRTTVNIHVGGIEDLLLSSVELRIFFFLVPFFFFFYHRRIRKYNLKNILPSPLFFLDLPSPSL